MRTFTSVVVANGAVWCRPPAGPHGDSDKGVTVLASWVSSRLPIEIHRLALERLTEATGDLHNLTGTRLGDVFVEEVTEVDPAAPGSVGTIDDTPPLVAMPRQHRSYRLHISNLASASPVSVLEKRQ